MAFSPLLHSVVHSSLPVSIPMILSVQELLKQLEQLLLLKDLSISEFDLVNTYMDKFC